MELSAIYEPIREDLLQVENRLRSVSEVKFSHLHELLSYTLVGGKGIRPSLTFLCGKLYDYNFDLLLPMALAVELMHIATLVHDDAIDNSAVRRGRPTINALWGLERAVLLGDYLFAKAGEFTALTQNLRVIMLFAQTLEVISSGELNQIFNAFNLKQMRQQYVERIASKTASLFSLATQSGAILTRAPEKSVKVLQEYGNNLGIAFQIVDDILDFIGTEEEMGKPIGSDLAQGTLTLPAILLLERYPEDNPVEKVFKNEDKQKNIKLAIELARDPTLVEQCYETAREYCSKARQNLSQLPDNTARQALADLTDYIVTRRK